jgi:hypothetical protein
MLIAMRILKLRDAAGNVEIPVRIFAPEEADGSWSCRYEIEWPDRKWSSAAGGFDSMQAIALALQTIGAVIYTSDYHKSGKLMWERAGEGYGFPVLHGARDLLVGDDRKFF